MTDLGVGLLYCADFQLSARIPLPTRYAGHPPPGGGNFTAPLGRWDVEDAVPYGNLEPIT